MTEEISDELLEDLYAWVDHIPLSRPKKDIRRDFADGGECLYFVLYACNHLLVLTLIKSVINDR